MKRLSLFISMILGLSIAMSVAGCGGPKNNAYPVAAPASTMSSSPSGGAMTMLQHHKTAASMAAGYAAYKMAKTTGQNRAAAGGHMNFAQRHPVMTGIGTAMLAHHMISKSQHH